MGRFDVDDSVIDAMRAYGAPPEAIASAQALAESAPVPVQEGFGVYADNLAAVNSFAALRTQWQYAGQAGQRMGLNYAGVSAWIDRFIRPRHRRALMTDLQLMESAVLLLDQEQRQKEE